MLNVAVFGATGEVGRLFTEQALEAGHSLTVLVRDRSKLGDLLPSRVRVIEGDATRIEDVTMALEGADVVVSCLGNVGSSRGRSTTSSSPRRLSPLCPGSSGSPASAAAAPR